MPSVNLDFISVFGLCLICFDTSNLFYDACLWILSFQVWAIADSKRQGFLSFKEFVLAMQVLFQTIC